MSAWQDLSSLVLPRGIIFDLDGVLTDTAELHYKSWQMLADDLRIPFDRARNEALRGLSREQSLAIVLGARLDEFSIDAQRELTRRKNDDYLQLVAKISPHDLFKGAAELLADLIQRGVRLAIGSSSRNAEVVLERLKIRDFFDVIVDGNIAQLSKPDPQVFQTAAAKLELPPTECLVIEDAESGVAAAINANMTVIGIGPVDRVGRAAHVVNHVGDITLSLLQAVWQSAKPPAKFE